jgi:hypothetical protein
MVAEDGATARGYAIPALAPPPLRLLERPLEYLLADHFRQRSLCAELRAIADKRSVARGVADAMMRRRLRREDNLGVILAQLIEDHRQTETMSEEIVEALAGDAAADPIAISQTIAQLILAFADSEHRHLAIENGIVLVIARKRLGHSDLNDISRKMKMRRGISV